jgi:vancomycin resistance protein YoaR
MEVDLQTEQQASGAERRVRVPVVILCALLLVLVVGYLVLCGVASGSSTFYPNYTINGVEVGGMTANEAQKHLERQLPATTVSIYADAAPAEDESAAERTPVADVTLEALGYTAEGMDGVGADFMSAQKNRSFFTAGWQYLSSALHTADGGWTALQADDTTFRDEIRALADQLNEAPLDGSYTIGSDAVSIVKARDGRKLDEDALSDAVQTAVNDSAAGYEAAVSFTVLPASTLSAQAVYDEVSGEMKNAGYDPASKSITPERIGATFDAAAAEELLENAAPGETVDIPAEIEYPAVTADALEDVLFRDVLGTYTTHVGGSAGRISNVKLASAAINGFVLNCGDVFSYNDAVGQRTEAKGYQAAPAYVKGETVDEIGGGVCQPSSTLYYACLLANLEIVQRAAHRYVPAYITKGIDATVSWGGPDYQFRNDTDYPIKISATYSKGYLTMKLFGTKTDGSYVKMISNTLSKTDSKTVYQDDATIPAGSQQVKVTPYTGYKVETYRNVYAADGTLLSSKLEAVSDYKVRDELILVGPKPAVAAETQMPAETLPPVEAEETPAEELLPDAGEPVTTETVPDV